MTECNTILAHSLVIVLDGIFHKTIVFILLKLSFFEEEEKKKEAEKIFIDGWWGRVILKSQKNYFNKQ